MEIKDVWDEPRGWRTRLLVSFSFFALDFSLDHRSSNPSDAAAFALEASISSKEHASTCRALGCCASRTPVGRCFMFPSFIVRWLVLVALPPFCCPAPEWGQSNRTNTQSQASPRSKIQRRLAARSDIPFNSLLLSLSLSNIPWFNLKNAPKHHFSMK